MPLPNLRWICDVETAIPKGTKVHVGLQRQERKKSTLSVGDRVTLRPGAEQRGCLAHGCVGTLVEEDEDLYDNATYKCEFRGATCWYLAADVQRVWERFSFA